MLVLLIMRDWFQGPPWIPKSIDAQVPYTIKWHWTMHTVSPLHPWIANTVESVDVEPLDMEGRLYYPFMPHISIYHITILIRKRNGICGWDLKNYKHFETCLKNIYICLVHLYLRCLFLQSTLARTLRVTWRALSSQSWSSRIQHSPTGCSLVALPQRLSEQILSSREPWQHFRIPSTEFSILLCTDTSVNMLDVVQRGTVLVEGRKYQRGCGDVFQKVTMAWGWGSFRAKMWLYT